MLVARDEQSCLVVSYKDVKQCIESAFVYVFPSPTSGYKSDYLSIVSWHGIARLQNKDLGIGRWVIRENIYNSEKNLKIGFSDGFVCTYMRNPPRFHDLKVLRYPGYAIGHQQ